MFILELLQVNEDLFNRQLNKIIKSAIRAVDWSGGSYGHAINKIALYVKAQDTDEILSGTTNDTLKDHIQKLLPKEKFEKSLHEDDEDEETGNEVQTDLDNMAQPEPVGHVTPVEKQEDEPKIIAKTTGYVVELGENEQVALKTDDGKILTIMPLVIWQQLVRSA